MDFKLLLTTFGAVFLAELGDKTQLATFSFAAGGQSRLAVFIGSAAALVLSSAIAVFFGEAVARFISPKTLTRLSAVLFLVLGTFMLWNTSRGDA